MLYTRHPYQEKVMAKPFVQSYEAWIESKAGACPPADWPMPSPPPYEADDEDDAEPRDE